MGGLHYDKLRVVRKDISIYSKEKTGNVLIIYLEYHWSTTS